MHSPNYYLCQEIYKLSKQTADVTTLSQKDVDDFTVTEMLVFIFVKETGGTLITKK
jgi:hypothetical protein